MPDRTATPEELLDQWLDALNEPGGTTSPAPAAIADLADVARDYRRALAPNGTAVAPPERNGKMHHAKTIATPNGATWRILAQPKPRKASWSSWLATAAVFALLVGLVGGAAMRTWGLPGGDDPGHLAGIAASPGATPAGNTLSCAVPGYLPIVKGDKDDGALTMFGGSDRVIRATDDGVFVPLPDGETRELPPDSFISQDSDVALAVHDDNSATVTRVSTGETWEYPAVAPRLEDQTWDFFSNGRYVIGPTDDSRTDWLITDTLTGETRTTADILGEPFDGSLDPLTVTSSDAGELWIVRFAQVFFSGRGETPPAEQVDAPGYLVIPNSLDVAWFSDSPISDREFETIASPAGTSFIATQTVRDAKTGERLDSGDDNLTYFGDLIGYLNEETLLTWRHDTLSSVDIHTAVATPIYTAPDIIQAVAWDRDAGMLAVGSGTGEESVWTLVDLATVEATPLPDLDGYQLANTSIFGPVNRVDRAAAFVNPLDDGDIGVRALDMRTGTVSTAHTTRTDTRVSGLESRVPAWDQERFVRTTDESGTTTFIDVASATTVALPVPDSVTAPEGGRLDISVVPDGNCATLTPLGVDNEPVGNTWIAPIEPGATWTELPFELDGWWRIPADDARTLPAQDFATPAASTGNTGLSCAAPGYVPVVRGDVDADALAEIGAPDAIVRGDTTTITAANGTEIVFGPHETWTIHWDGSVAFSSESEEAMDTVTSLATGQSWTFPVFVEESPQPQAAFMMLGGPWLIGAADDSGTDWRIVNIETGEDRLTSDIFGAPFSRPPLPVVGPWLDRSGAARMIAFSGDSPTPSVVLPNANLDDAWALPEDHVFASATGVITPDGSRIAYFRTSTDDASSVVTVLDGFNGEEIATWPGPETEDVLRTVGLTADDGKMILRDSQRVWTVDLETGEIATVFDPDGDIHEFAFDSTTGTALASTGDGPEVRHVWLDPATGELKDFDFPMPLRGLQPQLGWALIQTRDDTAVDYALLDMATGEIVSDPVSADRDENATNTWITGGDDTGVFVVQAESGRMLVLDGPGGRSIDLAAPETGQSGWNGISIGVSPNGGCLVYTEVGQGEEPGMSWIAPLEPDAEWTELPFELGPWIEMPPAPEVPVATPAAVPATPDPVADLLPDDAIPVVAADDPESVGQDVFATVGGTGPDSPPGITLPLPNGEQLELPDAIAIAQLPRVAAALVTNDDGSRQTVNLTSGETLVDDLPAYVEGEQWVGHYLLIPGREGTIWRLIDLLTGAQTDTATLGGGPFDREVTAVPMPSPVDAPRNVVVQFAFETSAGDLQPWQGLADDNGPISGTLVIPGSLADARFLDTTRFATIDSVDLMQPTIALSGGDHPLLAQVTRLANGRIVVEDAITGEAVASWETFRATESTDVTIAGFGPDGTSLVAWLTSVTKGLPDQVVWMHWDGHPAQSTDIDIENGRIQAVTPTDGQYAYVSTVHEPEAGVGPEWRWSLLDLESGEMTVLPELDGMLLHSYVPGDPWMIFNSIGDPRSASIVIVDAVTGEVAARLDDADLGVATARSSSRDGGVLVVTGHSGDEHTTGYVIDAASGDSWAIEPPFEGQVWYGVSPGGSLLTASTDAGDGWISPVAAGAGWIPLPEGRIVDWLWLPEGVR